MSNNRYAVTVRFNLEDQQNLRALAAFWKKSEKEIVKFAVWQLADSTRQLEIKLKQEEKDKEQENVSSETTSTGSSESSSPSPESTESQAAAAT